MRIALLVGATGLVGRNLLDILLKSDYYDKVKVMARKPTNIKDDRLIWHVIDFNALQDYSKYFKADDVYCCIGTTIKTAGSKDRFYQVDYGYPLEIAKYSHEMGAKRFLLISSMGADENSKNFYLRVKGKLEKSLELVDYKNKIIFRPGLLLGRRNESRPMEFIAQVILGSLRFLFIGPLKKHRPIKARRLANIMYRARKLKGHHLIYPKS